MKQHETSDLDKLILFAMAFGCWLAWGWLTAEPEPGPPKPARYGVSVDAWVKR